MRLCRTTLGVLLAALALSACGQDPPDTSDGSPPAVPPPDLTCPDRLERQSVDPDRIAEPVALPPPDQALLCTYGDDDESVPQDGQAGTLGRQGEPVPISGADLTVMADALAATTVVEDPGAQVCTMDYGPTWLVVYSAVDETFGLSIESFGCRHAYVAVPYDPEQPFGGGSNPVTGPLGVPTSLVDLLRASGS